MRPPFIAVLGTLNWDTTEYADGTRTENLGGLVYTLATLAALGAHGVRILPIANVGFDLIDRVRTAALLRDVEPGGLQRVDVPNNHVFLRYRDSEEREETLVGLVPPLGIEQCAAAADADLALVNLTSGRDLELETLQAFRARASGLVYLDVHSLTLGIEANGRRFLRRPERWQEWIAAADWVQVNAIEAALLGGGMAMDEFAAAALGLGPRGVVVTRGRDGCYAAWREAAGRRTLQLAPAVRPEPAYPTGCGDVFGATLAYALVRGSAVESALQLANDLASTKAAHEGLGALAQLRTWAAAPLARCFPSGA